MAHGDLSAFDNLDEDIFNDVDVRPGQTAPASYADLAEVQAANVRREFIEPCQSCGGSGQFRGYSGRVVGNCFKCKGTGKLVFRQSAGTRAKQAADRARRSEAKAKNARAVADAWFQANPEQSKWIHANRGSFEFASAMYDAVVKYGSLTENQLNAVNRCLARVQLREDARASAIANAVAIDVAPIVRAFMNAREKGIKRPKVRLGNVRFSRAPDSGANAGAIYVVRPETETYLGKIANGSFIRSNKCLNEDEQHIVEVCADPHAAAVAYGRRTGNCSCCGRELTKHASIDLGIGPICAEKYGWG